MGYTEWHQLNRPLEPITIAIDDDPDTDLVLTTTGFAYKNRGRFYIAASVAASQPLDVAYANTTAYKKGSAVINSGRLYTAKQDFTSGAAFNAYDWNDFGENSALVAGEYRWYALCVRYTGSGYTTDVVPFRKGLIADGYTVPTELPDWAHPDATPFAFVLIYGAVTPGTTALTSSNTKIVPAYGNYGA